MMREMCTCGRQHVLDEHEDGLLWADLDSLADDIHELTHSEISRHKVPVSSVDNSSATARKHAEASCTDVKLHCQDGSHMKAQQLTSSCLCPGCHSSPPSRQSPYHRKEVQQHQ